MCSVRLAVFVYTRSDLGVLSAHHYKHAIRRHAVSSNVWLTAHLPFVMGFTLSGAALSRLVRAHDCGHTRIDTLTTPYQETSEAVLADGLRWLYCCGLAVSFFCMAAISASHVHSDHATQRLTKRVRLTFRITIAIVWLCLPLAKSLNSLELIGTTTSLTVLTLALDIWGTSCKNDGFFSPCPECKYETRKRSRSSSTLVSLSGDEKQLGRQDSAAQDVMHVCP